MFGKTDQPIPVSADRPAVIGTIRRVQINGKWHYALADVIMWATGRKPTSAKNYWKNLKAELKQNGNESVSDPYTFKMPAADGKLRDTDVGDVRQVLRVIQEIPGAKTNDVKEWLADVGAERLEAEANPGLESQRARRRDLERLQRAGLTEHEAVKRLEVRVNGIETFKSLMAEVSRICLNPNYAAVVDAEYMALFHNVSKGLKELLNTKSIRDTLPRLQLSYLVTAEASLELALKSIDHADMKELLDIVDMVIRPLGNHLAAISERLGIHPVTGQPLLEDQS